MTVLRRLADFGLLVLLVSWFNWLLSRVSPERSFLYLWSVVTNHIYYSLLIIMLFAVFSLGLLSLIVIFCRWSAGIYWLRAAAETGYFFSGLILLVGFFRWLLVSRGGRLADPLWLTFVLIWLMYGAWFWLLKTGSNCISDRVALAVYGLLFWLILPLGASAFSFGGLTYTPSLISLIIPRVLYTGTGVCFLFFVRFYSHSLKKLRQNQ
ncbi:MAG: hypothetical protein ACQEP7_04130 [bacterium]